MRRILLTGRYAADLVSTAATEHEQLADLVRAGRLSARELLGRYCAMLYRRGGTYAEVADRTGLDRRTARKYVEEFSAKARAGNSSSRATD